MILSVLTRCPIVIVANVCEKAGFSTVTKLAEGVMEYTRGVAKAKPSVAAADTAREAVEIFCGIHNIDLSINF